MQILSPSRRYPAMVAMAIVSCAAGLSAQTATQTAVHPRTMPRIGVVDPRFVSYNIEAIEVTGGRFWKPFKPENPSETPAAPTPAPTSKDLLADLAKKDPYEYRGPIDLGNPKLRKLAAALQPSYLRISGTWQNSTFFQDSDAAAPATPPAGYKGVLTRAAWKGAIDFSRAVGADLVTSVAISDGTRDAKGVWQPNEAKTLFDYTRSVDGHIAAAEFMNEPTFAALGGAPAGYTAADFARDAILFRDFLRKESPGTLFLGPGSINEGVPLIDGMPMPGMLSSVEMLKDTGPIFDAFSYHFYTTISERCVGNAGLSWQKVLTPAYLDRNPRAEAFYAGLRDTYMPGKPIWNTETGEAACGGNRWASDFIDTFRYVDQLGILAQKNVQTVIVNTLAASEYGLLDTTTLEPRPDYWAALLWKRLMGTTVLNPGVAPTSGEHVYAHCANNVKGGVALVVLNLSQVAEQTMQVPLGGERYTLSAPALLSKVVSLNATDLKAGSDGTIPHLNGAKFSPGRLTFAPATITFLILPNADNPACK